MYVEIREEVVDEDGIGEVEIVGTCFAGSGEWVEEVDFTFGDPRRERALWDVAVVAVSLVSLSAVTKVIWRSIARPVRGRSCSGCFFVHMNSDWNS